MSTVRIKVGFEVETEDVSEETETSIQMQTARLREYLEAHWSQLLGEIPGLTVRFLEDEESSQ